MNFQHLDSYELLRLQLGTKNAIYYQDGSPCFIRTGGHSDFYYKTGRKAAELDLLPRSLSLPPSYTLHTWYKNGKPQLQATGLLNQVPVWYKYFHNNGKYKMFISRYVERHWDADGNTTACRVKINGTWTNLIDLIKQSNPNASQGLLNKVLNELIYNLRGQNTLPPYDSEYDFHVRRKRMTNLSKQSFRIR